MIGAIAVLLPSVVMAFEPPSSETRRDAVGDLSGLPPLLIQVGSHEILLSDAIRLAGRAAEADVAVTLEVVPGVPHVFQGFAAVLDDAATALGRAAGFLNANFAVTQR